MPNQVDERKSKITYAEWKPVRKEVGDAAKEHALSETEMFRKIILDFANRRRAERGKPIFDNNGRARRKVA